MRRTKGFTLIELMIVIAVIGILAKIALDQYGAYVLRGKVTEAFTQLSDIRIKMEQLYVDRRGNYGAVNTDCDASVIPTTGIKYFSYTCKIDAADPQKFTITAKSVGNGGMGPADSYQFTINEADLKRTTAFVGNSAVPLNCWVSSKGSTVC
ncbi:type IV pilin protein [Chitinimonas sp.]|uniref:type IV pilin protein n=1 Tax=Chitinimonas sp. TaxID=1934313 RepID=UPI0035B269AE